MKKKKCAYLALCVYQNIKPVTLMQLALKDDTLLWNQHLDDVTKKDFNKLQDIFINRNRPSDILNFLSIAKSFKTLQGPHEKFSSCT